jgi:uncharacterized membrane protein
MNKHRAWLLAEIEGWTSGGLIAPEQAAVLRARYAAPPAMPWGLVVFCSLGAVLLGLGIILLIAFNWAEIPRWGKLAIVVGTITAAHGTGLWLIGRDGGRRLLGEAFHLLGTMLYGAGIWLVAQAYHIDEHYPNGFLYWALGALAMAWVLRSVPQTVAAAALVAAWSAAEMMSYGINEPWALGLIAFGVLPLVWWRRSAVALAVSLLALGFVVLVNTTHWAGGGAAISIGMGLAVTCLGLTQWTGIAAMFPAGKKVLSFFGLLAFLLCCYLFTFGGRFRYWLGAGSGPDSRWLSIYLWTVFALAIGAWLVVAVQAWRRRDSSVPLELWLGPVAMLYRQIPLLPRTVAGTDITTFVFSGIFLGVAVVWIARGCRDARVREVVLGCVLFAIWTFARYFDLWGSLPARALTFAVLGIVLFGAGIVHRQRTQETAGRATP